MPFRSFSRKFILYDKRRVRTKDDRRCGRYLIRPKIEGGATTKKRNGFQFGFFFVFSLPFRPVV